jgi:hypothetical protein
MIVNGNLFSLDTGVLDHVSWMIKGVVIKGVVAVIRPLHALSGKVPF